MRFILILVFCGLLGKIGAAAQEALHVVILGDSNTWLGGDDCSKPKGWNYWFKEACQPASCRSYARSGATWTHTEKTKRNTVEYKEVLGDDNVMTNQIYRLEEAMEKGEQVKPNLIILLAGTNDAWFRKEKVSPESLGTQVKEDCERLRKMVAEGARIVVLTPMKSKHAGEKAIRMAGDEIEKASKEMEIETIRLDGMDIETYDGTHTSERGAQKLGQYLAETICHQCNQL